MFLILVNYIEPIEKVMQFREQHIEFLKAYYNLGRFLISGPKESMDGGVILTLGKNIDEVSNIASQDPFFINGVATFSIIEFIPKWYSSPFFPFIESGTAVPANVDLTQYI